MVVISEQGFSVRLSARIDQFLSAMEQAKKATKGVGDDGTANFQKLGAKMQSVGTTMTTHVSLPLVAAGGLAVKMSSDFESAFGRMVGLAGVEAGEVDGLKKSVLDLAGDTAKAPQELADALYEASSAGLDTAQAMDAVKVAAKASAAGMGSAQDIVGLVASATAAYGSANINAAKATDILTAAIREGRADPAELAGTLGRVLPIANQLGVSFEEVGGATAYLSNVFGDTNRTVTALQGFLVKLVSPTEQGRKALIEMGTSAEELRAAIDQDGLMGALALLKEHGFEANDQAMTKLFDDIEGRQGALALMADESGHLQEVMDSTKDSAGSLDSAFSAVSDTAGFKMKQAWADLQVALIQAGDIIMPIVTNVAGAVAGLATAFAGLPGPVQTIIVAFLGFVAAAGPVLMVAGSMIKNFKMVRETLGKVSTAAKVEFALIGVAAAGALYLLNNHLQDVAKTKAFDKERIDLFVQGLKEGSDAAGTLNKILEGGGDAGLTYVTGAGDVRSFADELTRAGLNFDDFQQHLHGTKEEFEAWLLAANAAGDFGLPAGMEGSKMRLDDINHLYNAGIQLIDQYNTAVQRNKEEIFAHGKALDGERHGMDGVKDSTDKAADAAEASVPKLTDAEEQQKANTEATKSMSEALDNSTNSFEVLAGAASLLKKALDAVFGGAQTLEDANETLIAAVDATTASIKENGKTLDINTEKGRNNRDAIQAQANAAWAQGVAMVGMGASQEEATAAINGNIAALVEQMHAAGLTDQEVSDYIATLGLTPEQVNTAIVLADTEATKERIAGLQEQLGVIDAGAAAEIQALIEEGKFAEAEQRLNDLARDRELNIIAKPYGAIIYPGGVSYKGVYVPGAAAGTPPGGHGGGPLWVGEKGRELIFPPAGSVVKSNYDSERLVSAASMGLTGASGSTSAGAAVNQLSATVNNYHQPVTVDVVSTALAMARLAA